MGLVVLLVVLPGMVLAAYCVSACRSRGWSRWRTASFMAGSALIIGAVLPTLYGEAHVGLRGHMIQHLLLGMFAPLGLVLGAPVTLLLRSVPARVARRIAAALTVRPVRWATHPVPACVLDIGGMYVLYLTPLFVLIMTSSAMHVLVHVHFVVAGCLFTWAIAGADPTPHRPGMKMRLAVLFLAMATHATLAKLMYAYGFPRGTDSTAAEIREAAKWMYYGGDLAEILLAVAFFGAWFSRRNRRRAARRERGPAADVLGGRTCG